MNVLERVQGCNRMIVQGHMEIEKQRMEGKRLEREVLRAGRKDGGGGCAQPMEQSLVGPSTRTWGKGP